MAVFHNTYTFGNLIHVILGVCTYNCHHFKINKARSIYSTYLNHHVQTIKYLLLNIEFKALSHKWCSKHNYFSIKCEKMAQLHRADTKTSRRRYSEVNCVQHAMRRPKILSGNRLIWKVLFQVL